MDRGEPVRGPPLPTGTVKPRERVLDPAETTQMIDALADIRDRALWAAAFHTGMRFGELRALGWEHVGTRARAVASGKARSLSFEITIALEFHQKGTNATRRRLTVTDKRTRSRSHCMRMRGLAGGRCL